MSLELGSPVGEVRGVGPVLARTLAAAGIHNVADLLAVLPTRYEDRYQTRALGELVPDQRPVTVSGTVVTSRLRRTRRGGPTLVETEVTDETGSLAAVWFNQPYLVRSMLPGRRLWLYGSVQERQRGYGLEMVSPELEFAGEDDDLCHMGRAIPIYRRVGSLSPRRWRALVARILDLVQIDEDDLVSWFPTGVSLPSRREALLQLHRPGSLPSASCKHAAEPPLHPAAETPAYRRLVLEELLALVTALELERQRRRLLQAPRVKINAAIREHARKMLPFSLTRGQRRVVAEVIADLRRGPPMARLLQGEVGSGKTAVAALAALVILDSGSQVAFLAPTELLARQHLRTLNRWLAPAGFPPVLLVGGLTARARRGIQERLDGREALMVVGTHALFEESVTFPSLGLAIIDEQHRFGVAQRNVLVAKGESPHLLVMTATPIPRSVALVHYGELDISILDELPPGRRPVRTVVRDGTSLPRLMEFVRREAAAGGRTFWVVPTIGDGEESGWHGVERRADELRSGLPDVAVGVAHGRMPGVQREETLAAFAAGRIQVLCATTIVEVGVDVPEATVMVIEHAQRFGLAQLHQLRGRVGRGSRRSLCVALTCGVDDAFATRRLDVFAATSDGFRISEEDLALRGPGEMTGVRQWGRPELRYTDLTRHREEVSLARDAVDRAVAENRLADLAAGLERLHPGRWRWQASSP